MTKSETFSTWQLMQVLEAKLGLLEHGWVEFDYAVDSEGKTVGVTVTWEDSD